MAKFLDLTGVTYLWGKIKAMFATKAELSTLQDAVNELGVEVQGQGSDIASLQSTKAEKSELGEVHQQVRTNTAEIQDVRNKIGKASGLATLDTSGKVPTSQLPSYVDDVLEFDAKTSFPSTCGSGKKI